ncbi:hypothetical protein HZP39_08970 [Elizabethkingia anophelis]|uniref:hypothetical protein n=1 Tax=Elizabethkingia TaxID=308865 RepID=UPI0012947150|nr:MULTISPECIES: hypothetical protein [Elizabethkingia]EJG2053243.1 hypothetical protein [Elizabethkingia anophelis]EJG2061846.1 hypothetical protein [Elizabethkingia anophelis]EJG2065518.1 hypothetical protein [Elizabethkingia anophelis]EJG2069316.1 hypothetical protein [Elizabethkingia anophelis]EJG2073244.1 hypothetical protein [Elizabethkingia anophelis]
MEKKEEIEELVENLYNKEKFRSQEYAKHLSLFKKRTGNKKWRKNRLEEIKNQLRDEN